MANELEALIKTEAGQQTALSGDITKGLSAQLALAQVTAILADLSATQLRRNGIINGAEERYTAAKASAGRATTGLADVDAMLARLPGTLTVAKLAAIVLEDLPTPPDATKKKHADYTAALAAVNTAVAAAYAALVAARTAETRARSAIDTAEAALQDTVAAPTTATAEAAAALADALRARSAGDFAGAYWHELRVQSLVAEVMDASTAVAAAEAALSAAMDAAAVAIDARIKAEQTLAVAQSKQPKAIEELGKASAQVLKKLSDAVTAAKAGP